MRSYLIVYRISNNTVVIYPSIHRQFLSFDKHLFPPTVCASTSNYCLTSCQMKQSRSLPTTKTITLAAAVAADEEIRAIHTTCGISTMKAWVRSRRPPTASRDGIVPFLHHWAAPIPTSGSLYSFYAQNKLSMQQNKVPLLLVERTALRRNMRMLLQESRILLKRSKQPNL